MVGIAVYISNGRPVGQVLPGQRTDLQVIEHELLLSIYDIRALLAFFIVEEGTVRDVTDVQITCINKIPGDDSHNGITHLGTAARKWTRQQVIIWINAREHTFYTMKDGKRADIYVYDDKQRPPHLQTYADDKWNDDLLALDRCK